MLPSVQLGLAGAPRLATAATVSRAATPRVVSSSAVLLVRAPGVGGTSTMRMEPWGSAAGWLAGAGMASKNTGVHAAIIAPEDVTLHDLDHCPSFDPAMAVVLFPSDDALEVQALQPRTLQRVFIIDSKKKAKELNQHPALRGVRRVRLTHHRSSFWRFHTSGVADDGVCTIECMLLFLRALLQHVSDLS
ncbi:DTW domain-containing protein [Haematococcus lacustris]|uniref:tRNA-uridine aminocarboxypropyltransferase 1 n=1 Tax=Haematococcus lacustris TaxID=44745 RepID=A0A699YD18_HAELA|nr:DTW domain-containing protein [Haematococcus lacustris]